MGGGLRLYYYRGGGVVVSGNNRLLVRLFWEMKHRSTANCRSYIGLVVVNNVLLHPQRNGL